LLDIKEALSRTAGVRKPLANVIHDPLHSAAAPPIPFQSRMPHIVEIGFIDSEQPEEPSHRSSSFETVAYPGQPDGQINTGSSEQPHTSSSQAASSQQNPPSTSNPNTESSAITPRETLEKLACKQVADSLAERLPMKKARKHQTCVKCAEPTCPGSQTVKNCKNPCRDCGERSCRGRNSKKPSTLCHQAWI
jgi:hypothetical protein